MKKRMWMILILLFIFAVSTRIFISVKQKEHQAVASIQQIESIPEEKSIRPEPTLSVNMKKDQDLPPEQLTPLELSTLFHWGESRGYFDEELSISDYTTMDENTLRTLALQNDPKAQMFLAKKILDNVPMAGKNPRLIEEAIHNLLAASVSGYTASLHELSKIMENKAIAARGEERKSMLLQAYKFIYLGIKRGDINAEISLTTLEQTSPLNDSDRKIAQDLAMQTYEDMNRQREQQKLLPFENGVPENIRSITQKIQRIYIQPINDALMKSAESAK